MTDVDRIIELVEDYGAACESIDWNGPKSYLEVDLEERARTKQDLLNAIWELME